MHCVDVFIVQRADGVGVGCAYASMFNYMLMLMKLVWLPLSLSSSLLLCAGLARHALGV